MYLNRFTINIVRETNIPLEKIKPFNIIYSDVEEQLFGNMPKKINVGGYGFINIKVHDYKNTEDWVKLYGQCVDCNLHSIKFDINIFLKNETNVQYLEVLKIYEQSLSVLNKHLDVDEEHFSKALELIRMKHIQTTYV